MSITENIPSVSAYTGVVPDKKTQTKIEFANNVQPYLNYINAVFVPQNNAMITSINTWTTEANTLKDEVNTLSVTATTKAAEASASADAAAQSAIEAQGAVATLPDGVIDDALISTTGTWSSSKINTDKQDTLVSGTNIKTISGTSVLGSGDINVNSSFVGCVATNTQNLSIASSANVQLSWNGISINTNNALSSSGDFTTPEAGKYFLNIRQMLKAYAWGISSAVAIKLYVNGGWKVSCVDEYAVYYPSSQERALSGNAVLNLAAGDVVTVMLFQNTGSTLSTVTYSYESYINIFKIGA